MERRRRLTSLRSVLLRYLCLCGGGCALILNEKNLRIGNYEKWIIKIVN